METKKLIETLSDVLKSKTIRYKSTDLCDSGNEIGLALGKIVEMMTQEQVEELITGIRHGISLTNNTH